MDSGERHSRPPRPARAARAQVVTKEVQIPFPVDKIVEKVVEVPVPVEIEKIVYLVSPCAHAEETRRQRSGARARALATASADGCYRREGDVHCSDRCCA